MRKYVIASNGKSNFSIVNHTYSDETVRFAAGELQKYLLKATNAIVPYFADIRPVRGPEIRLGAFVRGETGVEEGLVEDGFAIRSAGENITITASTSRGVLYGVYRFLEIFCGFQCFTKDVEIIDSLDTLEIELDEIVEEPAFEYRDAYFRDAFDGNFAAKNRLNASLCDLSVARGGRAKWFNFHHSFFDLVPPDKYFDTHPEYFSEFEGERIKDGQLCLSNPEVMRVCEETLRGWIKNNPECRIFSVAQNDNSKRCTCRDCMAIEEDEGVPSGPIIRFVNRLADAIKEDYPKVLLHTFAYKYSLSAPKLAVARDNVIVRLCTINCYFNAPVFENAKNNPDGKEAIFVNALESWKSHASRLYVWDYAVNFHNYLQPFINLHSMAQNIRYFKKNGIMGILEQGNFAYGGGASMDELKSYLIAKLLWNPDINVDAEIRRFVTAVYGKSAAQYVLAYLGEAERICSADAKLHIYREPDDEAITDEGVEILDSLFKKAIAASDNEESRKRLMREYLAVRFLKISRLPLEFPNRDGLVDEFIDDAKSFGITEIRERRYLEDSRAYMKDYRYAKDELKRFRLYYIMQ